MQIIMLGAPGAGKGTQAARIASKHTIPHISTGDIFRANIKEGTPLGVKAKSYMDKGELVPDELVCDLVSDRILKDDCTKGFILDGFPRTIPQAEALDKTMSENNMDALKCIDIEVPDGDIIGRMAGRRTCPVCNATYHIVNMPPKEEGKCDKCGMTLIQRDDDKEETVKNRLSVYHDQTAPLIDYYRKKGCLEEVDGTKSSDEVFASIEEILG